MSRRTFRQAFGAAAGEELGRGLGRLAVLGVVGLALLVPWLVGEYYARRDLLREIHAKTAEMRAAADGQ